MTDTQLLEIWNKQKGFFGIKVIPEVGALSKSDLDRMTSLFSDEIVYLTAEQIKRLKP